MKVLITHKMFLSEKNTVLNVINYGHYEDDKIVFATKDGIQRKTKQEIINSSINICSFEDIDIKDSLYYWFKNHPQHYGKKIVIDYGLTIGEIVKQYCWFISLMIATDDNSIYVKPIYE